MAVALLATVCGFTGALANAQGNDLVTAARRGDVAAVNALLNSGADVNARNNNLAGTPTALIEASSNGHLEVVQALLAAKADVNATWAEKKDGDTALALAVRKGHVAVVQALLAAKADVNAICCGLNILYDAVRIGNVDMVKALLAAKPALNRVERITGRTALMTAIDSGRWDVARLLVEAGADVNRSNNRGFTPLLSVVSGNRPGKLAMVQVLLAAHADPDFRDCDRSYMTALGFASVGGNVEVVRALLAAHADVNREQCDGKTPLALASLNGHAEVVELLRSAIAAPAAK